MPREMLKLRKGDTAIMIKKDGSMELAGVDNAPLMDEQGRISPVILFAAMWAKRDQTLINQMIANFKNTVREGYFGEHAQNDFARIEKAAASAAVTTRAPTTTAAPSGAVSMPDDLSPAEAAEYLNSKGVHSPDDAAKALQARGEEIKKKESEVEEAMNYGKQEEKNDPNIDPDDVPHDTSVVVDGVKYDPTQTEEEYNKEQLELKLLEERAQKLKDTYDPRHERQQAELLAGATKIVSKPMENPEKLPDLPVEQTMEYQKASNNDRKKMKEEEAKKKEEPIVGNVTIEEEIGNENK
jgi:hypothetical protein